MANKKKGLTIEELFKACKEQIDNGNGKKHILLSGDDEGNSYHELFYLFSGDITGSDISYGLPFGVDVAEFDNNYIVLG